MYGLDPATSQPPPALAFLPGSFPPPAPHLLDCSVEAAKAEAAEALGGDGGVPEWCWDRGRPDPPWLGGGDEDNLPHTRIAQADIWMHQHPGNCSETGVKFMYIAWARSRSHGLGSQFHLMTAALSVAMTHGRIFVVAPTTYTRANHGGCVGESNSSLDCYFESMTKGECGIRAAKLLEEGKDVMFVTKKRGKHRKTALTSETTLVVYRVDRQERLESNAA